MDHAFTQTFYIIYYFYDVIVVAMATWDMPYERINKITCCDQVS